MDTHPEASNPLIGRNGGPPIEPALLPDILAIRHAVFGDLVDKATFGKAINRSVRTVDRLIEQGMPCVPFIGQHWINPPAAHAWIMSRTKKRDRSPRRPGRPPRKGRV